MRERAKKISNEISAPLALLFEGGLTDECTVPPVKVSSACFPACEAISITLFKI